MRRQLEHWLQMLGTSHLCCHLSPPPTEPVGGKEQACDNLLWCSRAGWGTKGRKWLPWVSPVAWM